jgi:hypothetical protein
VARRFSCPEEALTTEIEFAITYVNACNPGKRLFNFGTIAPEVTREEVSAAIAGMLMERAESGLSGMTLAEDDANGEARN